MMVTSSIGTNQIVQQFAGDTTTQFDTVGIFSNGNTWAFTFDDVQVELVTGAAPEPSTSVVVAMLGMVVVGNMLRRRSPAKR